jgi:hypothetical protein
MMGISSRDKPRSLTLKRRKALLELASSKTVVAIKKSLKGLLNCFRLKRRFTEGASVWDMSLGFSETTKVKIPMARNAGMEEIQKRVR